MAYSQPRSSLRWISRLFIAGLLSLIIGAIFWDIPATDPQLSFGDRYDTCINHFSYIKQ